MKIIVEQLGFQHITTDVTIPRSGAGQLTLVADWGWVSCVCSIFFVFFFVWDVDGCLNPPIGWENVPH
jgi:hypothetical protein